MGSNPTLSATPFAEILFGDAAAADRLLEALLAAAPQDAQLMYLKGMRHLHSAEQGEEWESQAREARRWFTRAHRADANHFQTLYRFAQSLRHDPAYLSDNTRNVLLLAQELAPQVSEITMNAAMLLMSRREFREAEALLGPLAANPHDAGLAQAARQLIEQARTRTVPVRPAGAADETGAPTLRPDPGFQVLDGIVEFEGGLRYRSATCAGLGGIGAKHGRRKVECRFQRRPLGRLFPGGRRT